MLQARTSDRAMIDARSHKRRGTAKPRSRVEKHRFDGRSREAVRIRQLETQYRAEIGEVAANPAVMQAIRRAAELTMFSEKQRATMIRGEPINLSDLLRLEGVAKRAIGSMRELAAQVRAEQLRQTIHLARFRFAAPVEGRNTRPDAPEAAGGRQIAPNRGVASERTPLSVERNRSPRG